MATRRKTKGVDVYQMKVTLQDIRPPIWRRIQITSDTTLNELHEILQIVMGWDNYHLHEFEIDGTSYGQPAIDEVWSDLPEEDQDDKKSRLCEAIRREKTKFTYTYDFGDGWDHVILVEKILPPQPGGSLPDLPQRCACLSAGGLQRSRGLLQSAESCSES